MPMETISHPSSVEQDIEKKIKELKKAGKWEEILKLQGMPAELPQEAWECLEDSTSAVSAARLYANVRGYGAARGYQEGEHELFAHEIAKRYGISKSEARQLVEDSFSNFDRRSRN